MTQADIARLQADLPSEVVLVEDGVTILRPRTTAEVADCVRACVAWDVKIVPRGGNSNVCEMTTLPSSGNAVFLDLARMNRVLDVNAERATITVEAGCILETVQAAAVEANMFFAPDWGARGSAMIGGAVATNGGGQNVLRYGTTREQVLGMEVVLPDGRVWEGMRSLVKDNSGYDLKQLFIGSEGTLGIITKLVLRLHPARLHQCSMMAVLSDTSVLTSFLGQARAIAGGQLEAFELINGVGYERALERYPDLQRPLEARADWYVLLRLAGAEPVEDQLTRIFEAGFENGLLEDAVMAQNERQEQTLWEIRDQMIPKQYFPKHRMCKWDVSVPIDSIIPFLDRAHDIALSHHEDAIPYAVGHVGDGNIHYSIFIQEDPSVDIDALSQTYLEEIDHLIWSMGGSVTAEHGVGRVFVDRVRQQKSEVEYDLLQGIKSLIDPENRMNPGKLLKYER